jgi:type 1 glutamine amidotransferase
MHGKLMRRGGIVLASLAVAALMLSTAGCATSPSASAVKGGAKDGKKTRILYLSKSAGFEHDVIKTKKGAPSVVDKVLTALVAKMGGEITCTKDASLINAENLKNYDVVIFYTTGVLTEVGTDKNPPMGPDGQQALLDWIKTGKGFLGFHAANDTFHSDGTKLTPFVEMIGGEFDTHGGQFKGTVKPVSPGHPAIADIPANWNFADEWYISKNLNTAKMHVLALLEIGAERAKQEKYNMPDYPIIWCRAYGDGRVLYNALGHRDDVWNAETFQKVIVDNIKWVRGDGPLMADPNYDAVVPKTVK